MLYAKMVKLRRVMNKHGYSCISVREPRGAHLQQLNDCFSSLQVDFVFACKTLPRLELGSIGYRPPAHRTGAAYLVQKQRFQIRTVAGAEEKRKSPVSLGIVPEALKL